MLNWRGTPFITTATLRCAPPAMPMGGASRPRVISGCVKLQPDAAATSASDARIFDTALMSPPLPCVHEGDGTPPEFCAVAREFRSNPRKQARAARIQERAQPLRPIGGRLMTATAAGRET